MQPTSPLPQQTTPTTLHKDGTYKQDLVLLHPWLHLIMELHILFDADHAPNVFRLANTRPRSGYFPHRGCFPLLYPRRVAPDSGG